MLILRPEEVEGLLAMTEAVAAVEKAFSDWGKYPEINLTRRRLHFGDARLCSMPAVLPSAEKSGLRIQSEILAVSGGVQLYPSRSPLVDVLFDTRTALPVAMILSSTQRGMTKDGIPLRTSDLMTAAISAVGTKWMSRADATELVLLGSGKQARNHLIAMTAIRSFKRVNVFSPTQRAQRYHRARRHRARGYKHQCAGIRRRMVARRYPCNLYRWQQRRHGAGGRDRAETAGTGR